MASSSKRVISQSVCNTWIYGPQVSDLDKSYNVGGPTWKRLYDTCNSVNNNLYGYLTPERIVNYITVNKDIFQEKKEELISYVTKAFMESKNILDVLLVHSAFINAFGLIVASTPKIDTFENRRILEVFKVVHELTYKIIQDESTINIFVSPTEFETLNYMSMKRPSNITIYYEIQEIINLYNISNRDIGFLHPITRDLKNCLVDPNVDCTLRFAHIKNTLFKPLADVISCHCSFFKQKLEKSKHDTLTFNKTKKEHVITNGDINFLKQAHQRIPLLKKPPILIKKYTYKDNVCEKKTYLSQLFEKVCMLVYKPYYITPKTNTREDIIIAAKENYIISSYHCTGYSNGNLSIFETPILKDNSVKQPSNIPVFFVFGDAEQQERIYVDNYSGPATQYFTDVIKEIYEHKIFLPSTTMFNNQRYELNTGFDISKLSFYNNLPDALKIPEIKQELTEHFFLFIGNVIHFAVANNIELPFKLSRIYIMQLFNLFDFVDIPKLLSQDNLKQQLLFISVYLLEKAPTMYTQQILKIFENPEVLLSDDTILILDNELLEGSAKAKGVRMNGYSTLVEDKKNIPLYSTDEEKMFYNIVKYICKTGIKSYFEKGITDEPVTRNKFKVHKHIDAFFKGFRYTKNFGASEHIVVELKCANFNSLSFQQKLGVVRKADIFLSGFGLTYEIIKELLIPRIIITRFNSDIKPLEFLNTEGRFIDEYMPDTSLTGAVSSILTTKFQEIDRKETNGTLAKGTFKDLTNIFLLYRILLNRGKDISKDFIAAYNQKFYNIPYDINTTKRYGSMTDEDYHNEFVKLLLKAWSAVPTIDSSKDYTILYNTAFDKLPQTHTCFNRLDINKDYTTATDLYKDLVILSTVGTDFGEALTGGRRKKSSRKKK